MDEIVPLQPQRHAPIGEPRIDHVPHGGRQPGPYRAGDVWRASHLSILAAGPAAAGPEPVTQRKHGQSGHTEVHAPNDALRAVRIGLRMSQDDLAKALRRVGVESGEPNEASKRLVQRWESGISRSPRPVYIRALERVTGVPIE
ncbi:hypothetical protein GCM10010390_69660 [Streptomyces mordarskii]|uniref:HTH cro/C1-type domain-containing protein n=1 Tax=Streptomyces mordarskii TaxID=1226758 RepID=A0ABP3P409_9ACTN